MKRHLWTRWLRSLFPTLVKTGVRAPLRRPVRLEGLEDRLAPATFIWSGAGTNNLWSTGANWVGGVAPSGSALTLDDLVFPNGPTVKNTVNNLTGATFNSITFSGAGYTLGGNAINLGSPSDPQGGNIIVSAGQTNNRIDFNMTLGSVAGDNQFVTVNFGADLAIAGQLSGSAGGELTKDGVGTLILAADNSAFTGPIRVNNSGGILRITHRNALGSITAGTTVGQNAQLQVSDVLGSILEPLILNGPGISNDGALRNFSGDNTWAGNIQLDSNTSFGAASNTNLTIGGQITDLGAGHSITKEGAGRVIFDRANNYRGTTTINNGFLRIRDPLSLGEGGQLSNGTIVNQTLVSVATLEIEAPSGGGFIVLDEILTLNGTGVGSVGALSNVRGNNTWAADIIIGSPSPNGRDVFLGAELDGTTQTELTISGRIIDQQDVGVIPGASVFNLTKVRPGRVIFTNANLYRGFTTIAAGTLTIRDSRALGSAVAGTQVSNGAALELEVDSGFDPHGRDLSNDSVTGNPIRLRVSEPLTLLGMGVNNTGALRSVSGINEWVGGISLSVLSSNVAIGVEPDSRPDHPTNNNTYFTDDYSLTVNSVISGPNSTNLHKVGDGHLILPVANSYTGLTFIDEGWVTVQNNQALGGRIPGRGDTAQPGTTVAQGAALHLKPLFAGASLNLLENLTLEGNGIQHPFALIDEKGALMNLEGVNTASGELVFKGLVGIGVEEITPGVFSELTLTGSMSGDTTVINVDANASGGSEEDARIIETGATSGVLTITYDMFFVPDVLRVYYPPRGQPGSTLLFDSGLVSGTATVVIPYGPGSSTQIEIVMNEGGQAAGTVWDYSAQIVPANSGEGGINKLGSKRLQVQGDGTYTGAVIVTEGVLRAQNDTALGAPGIGTIVRAGAALELGRSVPALNGGVAAGVQVWGETLTLEGSGNTTNGDLITPLTILSDDFLWQGPVSLNNDVVLHLPTNSRLTLLGPIQDGPNASATGSNLTLTGGGHLALGGNNTYRGTTYVQQGVLTVLSNNALGGGGLSEMQTVTVNGSSGTFTLTFKGQTTTPLPFNAPAFQVQAALAALSTIGGAGGAVFVTQTANVYTVHFGGQLLGFDLPEMTAAGADGADPLVATLANGTGATIVADGAALHLQGGLTIANEPLLLQGNGRATTAYVPERWFAMGPEPIDGLPSVTNQPLAGRITSAVTDPSDPNVIYVTTAGGGAWRTKNSGLTWEPLFDLRNGINEIQEVTVTGSSGTFTLEFNGETTVDLPFDASARQVQDALNALSTIGGMFGSVDVTKAGNVYTVTFANNLSGMNLPEMIATGADGADASVATIQDGIDADVPIFVGAIAIDPTDPRILYIGTGETNNTPDSFYGTGVYRSIDSGKHWTLVTDDITDPNNPFNPFEGKGISKIIVDPNSPSTLYVASGDGGTGSNEIQRVSPNVPIGSTFTLTFTGVDATGAIISATTVPITRSIDRDQVILDMQNALNALPNIGGIGGFVTVTRSGGGGPGGNNRYNITFGGALALTNVEQLTGNPPPPPGNPNVAISTFREGGNGKVANGSGGGAGVWRLQGGVWVNLTAIVSVNRATANGQAPFDQAPPRTPGPDDDYRVTFPDTDATWSDIALIYTDISNTGSPNRQPVLYAALGTSSGSLHNGVFWTRNPTAAAPIWYVGAPGGTNANPATAPTGVDARSGGQFPVANYGTTPPTVLNGNIKITAFAGNTLVTSAVYASVATPVRTLRGIFASQDGGHTWTQVTSPPTYLASQGDYANAIFATSTNTVYVGGFEVSPATHLQHVFRSTDSGGTWTDISVDTDGNTPHTGTHAFTVDSTGRVLIATDGGLWRLESGNLWANLNGNLAVSQVNGIATHPTDPNIVYAGFQSNGTAWFSNDLTWAMLDDRGGGQIRIDPLNPNTLYHVQLQFGANAIIRKSVDGGLTWTSILTTLTQTAPLVLDSINPSRLLVGSSGAPGSLRESLNQGSTWTNLNAPLITVREIAIATFQGDFVADPDFPLVTDRGPSVYDPDTIYITDGDQIYLSKNHGLSWVDRTNDLDALGGITKLVVDPRNRDTVYAVRSRFGGEQIWVTTDAGLTWTDITHDLPDIPVWTLVIDPRTDDLYIGTDQGVWKLAAGTTSWQRFGSGLPSVQVRELELNQKNNMLVAGTYGRSVYRLFLDEGVANGGALRAVSGASVWTGPIVLAGNTSIAAGGTQELNDGQSTASLTIVGTISDQTPGDNWKLDKTGQGNVILAGVNTYGGVTEILEGVLVVQNPQALGSPLAGTIVNPGTALELQSDLNLEPLQLFGDGIPFNGHNTGALRNSSNNNVYTGNITLMTDSTIGVDTGTRLTITGSITDADNSFTLTKELTGTLVLANANTYDGETLVHQGILRITHAQALGSPSAGTDVLDGAQLQLEGGITVVGETLRLSGTGIFGTGALLNTGGNNTWQGNITFLSLPNFSPTTVPPNRVAIGVTNTNDSLTIDGSIGQTGGTFGLEKVGPGKLILKQANTYGGLTSVVAGILNVQDGNALGSTANGTEVRNGATLELEHASGMILPAEALILNGSGVGGLGALRNVSGNNQHNGTVTLQTNTTIAADPNSSLTLNGVIQDPNPVIVPPTLTKIGAGTFTFTAANTYTGRTLVNEGALNIAHAQALGLTLPEQQTVAIGGVSGTFTLTFLGQTTTPLANNATANDVRLALEALSTIGAGNVLVTKLVNVFTITFVGSLSGQNVPQLVAQGFSGTTTNVQTVRDGANNGTIVASGATLGLQGGITVTTEQLTITGQGVNGRGALENVSGNNAWSDVITMTGHSAIGVTNAADRLLLDDAIVQSGGSFGVTKVGPGTLEYAGGAGTSNTYTGLTQVNEGTLALNKTAGAIAVNGNLTIGDNQTGDAIVQWLQSDQIPNNATILINQDGLLDLNGLAETIATLRLLDGRAQTGQGGILTASAVDMTGGSIRVDASGQLQLAGNVIATSSATGSAHITGAGQLSLNGANRTFTITDGPADSDLLIDAVISGLANEGILKNGSGRLELDAVNTYSGPTTIAAGDVQVDGTIGNVQLTGGSLSGSGTVGTITGNSPAVGAVDPGNTTSTGILTSSDVEWGPQTTFRVELNGTTPGTGHDQLQVNGTISLGGANLVGLTGPDVLVGDSFTIVTATGGITGQFAQGDRVFVGGRKYTIQYLPNAVVLTRVKADVSISITSTSNPSLFGQEVTWTARIVPEPGASVNFGLDSLTFVLDGNPNLTVTKLVDANGIATLNTVTDLGIVLSVGAHSLQVTFNENADYTGRVETFSQVVNKASTTTTLSTIPTNPVFGQSVVIRATVNPVAPGAGIRTGNVTFIVTPVGGSPLSPFVAAVNATGFAEITLPSLDLRTYTVQATYAGDVNFNGSTAAPINFTVVKANATVTVSSVPSSTPLGQPVTFTATVTATPPATGQPTGSVTFWDGPIGTGILLGSGTLNSGGQASILISSLGAGTHTISVQYTGDINFNSSVGTLNYTVSSALTSTSISSSANPSTFGQSVTFTATVTSQNLANGTPVGTVTFVIDGVSQAPVTLDAQGRATLQVSSLSVGTHTIVANFDGSTNFAASNNSLTQTVNPADTSTTIATSLTPAAAGQAVTFTATVRANAPGGGIPTGTVTFFINGVAQTPVPLDGQGQATLTRNNLSLGNHQITARFNGSAEHNASPNAPVLTQRIVAFSSTTVISASASPSVSGQSVTFTATVRGPNGRIPTGSVTFFINGVAQAPVTLNAQGRASIGRRLGVGVHTIEARYNGSSSFASSTGIRTQIVNPANTSVAITSNRTPAYEGQSVTVTANVSAVAPGAGTPTGQVIFTVDGVAQAPVNLSAGRASIVLSGLTLGNHTITAQYLGSPSFNARLSGVFVQRVAVQPPATKITATVSGQITVGVPFSINVLARNAQNTLAPTYNAPVTWRVISAPAGGVVSGSRGTTFVDGRATFTGLTVNRAGRYVIRITSGRFTFDLTIVTFGRVV